MSNIILNSFVHIMLILGSCLALNLSYSGCCKVLLSPSCINNGCYCDQSCYHWNDCCSDIADIGCHLALFSSPIVLPTPTDTFGRTKFIWITCLPFLINLIIFTFIIKYYYSHILLQSNIHFIANSYIFII